MTKSNVAIDSNILVYLHQLEPGGKFETAINLMAMHPVISTQAISEYINVLKRLLPVPKATLLRKVNEWLKNCIIVTVLPATIDLAASLIEQYDFQVFDAIIVASALEKGCTILYSEDMQHGLVVRYPNRDTTNTVTIINPFI
jgi:predicted nucleic acid-binding protein